MKLVPDQPELWNQFASCERNEMIITKSGRCLFPLLKFHLQLEPGDEEVLDLREEVRFSLGIERVDGFKWKFRNGHWYPLPGATEKRSHWYEPVDHSPATLSALLLPESINFSKVKLSNRRDYFASMGRENYFYLSSFCHYRPVIQLKSLKHQWLFVVDECSFIAVTHYQNESITHLKKHNNPHAKGFLSPDTGLMITRGRPGRKRKLRLEQMKPDQEREPEPENSSFEWHTDDVIQASLVLETMSRTPRYEEAESNATNANTPNALPLRIPKYLTFNHRRQ